MRKIAILFVFLAFVITSVCSTAESSVESAPPISAEKKRLFFVDSYHKGYRWSDDIEKGLRKALSVKENADGSFDISQSSIQFKVFRMNTKLKKSETLIKQAALSAKAIIEEWKPDVVVACDDNASKYLLAPYYKNNSLPFVFCGLNWDASVYGFPVSNITGMVEVAPVLETIGILKLYSKGFRVGYIGVNTLSAQKSLKHYKEQLKITFTDGKLVDDFPEWKREYLKLQDSVDMLVWLNPIGIKGWNDEEAILFINENTKIPTGASGDIEIRYALIGSVKIAEEQGWWAGKTALKILAGTSPADIPVTTNQQSRLHVNMKLANRLGIKFPVELLKKATIFNEQNHE